MRLRRVRTPRIDSGVVQVRSLILSLSEERAITESGERDSQYISLFNTLIIAMEILRMQSYIAHTTIVRRACPDHVI